MMLNPDLSLSEFNRESLDPSYEPWLFQTMIDELATNELGIGFIYSLLEQLAKRYELSDAVVVLEHESLDDAGVPPRRQRCRRRATRVVSRRLRGSTASPTSCPRSNSTRCARRANSRWPCTWRASPPRTTR